MADSLYWVWLAERLGAGNVSYVKLLEHFGSPYEIYRADEEELYHISGRDDKICSTLRDKSLDRANKIIDYCERNEIGILTYDDGKMPERLKQLRNCPMVLYYRGKLPDFDNRVCIAIVGTRKTTEYGEKSAYKMSYEIASAGAVVVSGMALGIDGIAACGAIEAGGITCAVLGCGLDIAYPREHKKLMNTIACHGAVISEYAPGTNPERYNFPMRNRIISGLCQGTLVVEADLKSGSLITAKEAIYQARDVYALPGNIDGVNSEGVNKLIKDGAQIVTEAEDILQNYEFLYSESISYLRLKEAKSKSDYNIEAIENLGVSTKTNYRKTSKAATGSQKEKITQEKKPNKEKSEKVSVLKNKAEADMSILDDISRAVYEKMPNGTISADEISRYGIPISDVMTALTMLEINGFISALPGGLYIKR